MHLHLCAGAICPAFSIDNTCIPVVDNLIDLGIDTTSSSHISTISRLYLLKHTSRHYLVYICWSTHISTLSRLYLLKHTYLDIISSISVEAHISRHYLVYICWSTHISTLSRLYLLKHTYLNIISSISVEALYRSPLFNTAFTHIQFHLFILP